MQRHSTVFLAKILTIVALGLALAACAPSSPGAQIFATGRGHAGAIPRSTDGGTYSDGGPGCAFCHGDNGAGGGIGPPSRVRPSARPTRSRTSRRLRPRIRRR